MRNQTIRGAREKWYNCADKARGYLKVRELNRVKWKRALRHVTYKIRRQAKDLRKLTVVTRLLSRLIYKYYTSDSRTNRITTTCLRSVSSLSFISPFLFSLILSFRAHNDAHYLHTVNYLHTSGNRNRFRSCSILRSLILNLSR